MVKSNQYMCRFLYIGVRWTLWGNWQSCRKRKETEKSPKVARPMCAILSCIRIEVDVKCFTKIVLKFSGLLQLCQNFNWLWESVKFSFVLDMTGSDLQRFTPKRNMSEGVSWSKRRWTSDQNTSPTTFSFIIRIAPALELDRTTIMGLSVRFMLSTLANILQGNLINDRFGVPIQLLHVLSIFS